MQENEKKAIYNRVMENISKQVKSMLNEDENLPTSAENIVVPAKVNGKLSQKFNIQYKNEIFKLFKQLHDENFLVFDIIRRCLTNENSTSELLKVMDYVRNWK